MKELMNLAQMIYGIFWFRFDYGILVKLPKHLVRYIFSNINTVFADMNVLPVGILSLYGKMLVRENSYSGKLVFH